MKNEDKIVFFDSIIKLLNSNNNDPKYLQNFYNDILNKYNSHLNIAKCECSIMSPKNMVSDEKDFQNIIIYDNDNSKDENPFIVNLEQTEESFVQVKYYPNKGSIFTSDNIEFIKYLSTFIHMHFAKEKYKTLLSDARHIDFQTGIPNMMSIIKFGSQLANLNILNNYTLIFGNIRSFKNINQLYGTEIANNIIKEYFNYYNSIMGENEMCARPGGDNIVMLVKNENIDYYLNELSSVVIKHGEKDITLKTNIGYFNCMNDLHIGESMEKAKMALEINKNISNEPHKYDQEDEIKIAKEKEIKESIIDAMRNNELVTYYQPKVDINDFNLCGCEALVRWYKNNELVKPSIFIPVIESSNLICELDFYMLNNVCSDIRKWIDEDISPVKTSINFSMKHIKDRDAINEINKILDYYHVNHKLIEIELTELTDYRDYNGFIEFISDLRKNNYRIAMDDFGSGYSSLNLLKQVDYDIIKLDKGIIDDISKPGSKNYHIVKNMIKMIKDLKMEVIAEGVESLIQIELLKYLDCDQIQGYYFDKPLTKDEFTKRLIKKDYWSDRIV